MAADGSIIINTEIDDKKAQTELNKLSKSIQKTENELYKNQKKQSSIQTELEAAKDEALLTENAIKKIKAELATTEKITSGQVTSTPTDFISAQGRQAELTAQLNQQTALLSQQDRQTKQLDTEYTRITDKVIQQTQSLNMAKTRAGELSAQLARVSSNSYTISPALEKAQKAMAKFASRLRGVISSALVFTVISRGLALLREWLGKVIQTNAQASAAVATLKNSLLALAQPLMSVVIPVFVTFLNVLARIINTIARFVSAIFGSVASSAAQSTEELDAEAGAIGGVGSAAEEASKSLASFDTINQISDTSSGSGGGGGGGGSSGGAVTTPDFTSPISESLIGIVELFTGIALLALGAIFTFTGAHVFLGIGLMVLGAAAVWDAVSENWGAIAMLLQGPIGLAVTIISSALLVIGAILAFSGTAVPLGIGLMIVGAASLAAVAAANWNTIVEALQGPIGMVTALVGTALLVLGAIFTFSGGSIPLGIGLMVVGAASLAAAIAPNWDAIVEALQGPIAIVTAIVSTAFLVLGAILTISGANIPLGIGLLVAGAVGLATVIAPNWNTIVETLKGPIGRITAIVSGALLVLGIILCASGVALPLGIALLAAGAVGLVSVAAINWDGILDALKGVWDKIKNWWNSKVKKFFTAEYWKDLGKKMINGLIGAIESGINFILKGVSGLVNGIIDVVNVIPGVNIGHVDWANVKLPRLAQGAVIPPNREFLAVLGDQTSGTNIEAPLTTIEQAVENVLRRNGYNRNNSSGDITVILELDNQQLGRAVFKAYNAENTRRGVNLVGV